jgi:malate synthase
MRHEHLRDELITPTAAQFLISLHERFDNIRQNLLIRRKQKRLALQQGETPQFIERTRAIRESEWKVAILPADLQKREVEITGPAEAKTIINGLNSGADIFMADFEDALSPTWENILKGQAALKQAVRQTLRYTNETGKEYALSADSKTTLVVRPRGLHLDEPHFLIRGKAISASLLDFGLYFFHNVFELQSRDTGVYLYLPKIESHDEALWWNNVFSFAQGYFDVPRKSIRATVLIETLTAAFEMDEILYALKDYVTALNAGRWDYIFSIIKNFHHHKGFILPDRDQVTMTAPFMEAYCRLLVQTCHRRGALAIGGMAAFIPNRSDPDGTAKALQRVAADKAREAKLGFDGTWVAHPDLIRIARTEMQKRTPESPSEVRGDELLAFSKLHGYVSESGIRLNINVSLLYLDRWLSGQGAASIHSLMEDLATAEISRSQLWLWLHHQVVLRDGRMFTADLYHRILSEEMILLRDEDLPHLEKAVMLLNTSVLSKELPEFLSLSAYETLSKIEVEGELMPLNRHSQMRQLENSWSQESRWRGIQRKYTAEDVLKLRTSVPIKYTLAETGAHKLWQALNGEKHLATFGAMSGAQAVQMVKAGIESIYLSGWQVAADANLAGQTYPDQSLYPSNSVPAVVRRINNAFMRADQIANQNGENTKGVNWYAPIVADAEAGFGGPLHAFELMKSMIEAGASGVHFEDQLAAEKKCGHLAGKVLVPTANFVRTLQAARLAADVLDVPTVIIARTDALSANLLTSDIDTADHAFLTGDRTPEGYHIVRGGLNYAVARALVYAPWADVLWFETSKPDLQEARQFADAIHSKYPGKILAYNCSPSFNWKLHLSEREISKFQEHLNDLGYKFQFITLAGWHLLNYHTFELAYQYAQKGMSAYVELQEREFAAAKHGYTGVRHQAEVGTGYFDQVLQIISEGQASTGALKGSTEEQFAITQSVSGGAIAHALETL